MRRFLASVRRFSGRRRNGRGGLRKWFGEVDIGGSDAAGGGDADDEAQTRGPGFGRHVVVDLDATIEAAGGGYGFGGVGLDDLGVALELLALLVEGGGDEDDLGVAGL